MQKVISPLALHAQDLKINTLRNLTGHSNKMWAFSKAGSNFCWCKDCFTFEVLSFFF